MEDRDSLDAEVARISVAWRSWLSDNYRSGPLARDLPQRATRRTAGEMNQCPTRGATSHPHPGARAGEEERWSQDRQKALSASDASSHVTMHSRGGPSLYTRCTAGAEGPRQLESKGPQNQLHGDIHKQCHMEKGAVPLVLCRGGKHAYSPCPELPPGHCYPRPETRRAGFKS